MKKNYLFVFLFLLATQWMPAQDKTFEDFEGDYFPPLNWTIRYANPTPTEGNLMCISEDKKDGNGSHSFRFSNSDRTQNSPFDQYLISPELDLSQTDTLEFRYWVPAYGSRYFYVGWSSTGTDIEKDFTWTERITSTDEWWTGYESWATYSKKDLPAGTKYICIKYEASSAGPNNYFYIDNIRFPKTKNVSLPIPANLKRNPEDGKISWSETGSAQNWEIVVTEALTADLETAPKTEISVAEYTPVEPLKPLTYYVVYVRSKSGSETSAWSSPIFFRTGCPEYYVAPWTETFENLLQEDMLPDCQSVWNSNFFGSKKEPKTYNFYENQKPHTGKGFAYFKSDISSTEIRKTQNWYFSPKIKTEAGKTYKISVWYITDEDYGFDTLAIGLGPEASPSGMQLQSCHEKPHTGYYRELSTYYTAKTEEFFHIGLYFRGTYDKLSGNLAATYLNFDDFSIEEVGDLPIAGNPRIDRNMGGPRSLAVSWDENKVPSKREISLGLHGQDFRPEDSILDITVNSNSVLLSQSRSGELLPDTEYDIYIRLYQGDAKSAWTGPLTVKTSKEALTLPVLEDCSGITEQNELPEKIQWISHLEGGMRTKTSNDSYSKLEGHGDSKYIHWYMSGSTGEISEEWIIMRGVEMEQKSYDFSAYLLSNGKEGIDTIEFLVGNRPEPAAMKTLLGRLTGYKEEGYTPHTYSYMNSQEEGLQYFGIRLKGRYMGYGSSANLCIDDLSIQPTPDCKQPTGLTVDRIESDRLEIHWQGTAQTWEIAYCEGENFDFSISDTLSTGNEETTLILSGLSPQTTYSIRVRGNCGETDGFSSWSDPVSATTICADITAYPFNENFEEFENSCWTTFGYDDGEPDDYCQWEIRKKGEMSLSDIDPLQGNQAILFKSYFKTPKQVGDLVSPNFDMSGKEYTGIEFFWWNMEDCDDPDVLVSYLYLQTQEEEGTRVIDSIRLCGCPQNTTGYARYQRVFDFPIRNLILRTSGTSTEYNRSNTLVDSLTVDAFTKAELPEISNLTARTEKNSIRLDWDAAEPSSSSFRSLSHYIIVRNGIEVAQTENNHFTDTGLPKGEHAYRIIYVSRAGLCTDTAETKQEIEVETYRVDLLMEGARGIIEPEAGTYHFVKADKLHLEARAIPGETVFLGWDIDGEDTVRNAETEITIEKDLTVKALFADIVYPVTVRMEGEGIIHPETGTHIVKSGDSVLFKAEPANTYWSFEKWIQGDQDTVFTDSEFKLAITDTLEMTAVFTRISYKLNMKVIGEGRTEPASGTHEIAAGDTVRLSATPEPGFRFVKWNISNNTVTSEQHWFIMERTTTVTAYFEKTVEYQVNISQEGNGRTEPGSGTYTYEENDTLRLKAIADEGWSFNQWIIGSDTVRQAETSCVVMTDLDIKAVFTPKPKPEYILTISMEGEGLVQPEPGEHTYLEGDTARLKAEAAEGWAFSHWLIGKQEITACETSVILISDTVAKAVFIEKTANENSDENPIRIYPNPAKEHFRILSAQIGIREISIYSVLGKEILKKAVHGKDVWIESGTLPEGSYLIRILFENNQTRTERIIVQ